MVLVVVLTIVTVTLPQLSLAVGASKLQLLPHSTLLSAAHEIIGGIISTTVTVWLQGAELPH
jgi:hypothetical protein